MKRYLLAAAAALLAGGYTAKAQLDLTAANTPVVINFDNTVDEVNNGELVLSSAPAASPAAGQLDSDAWTLTGSTLFRGQASLYSGIATSSTNGGFYAFETSTGDYSLGVQPNDAEFTPGTITLEIVNNTGATRTAFNVLYDIKVVNDQNNSSSLNFSYTDNMGAGFTAMSSADFTSPENATSGQATFTNPNPVVPVPVWETTARSISITGVSVADGGSLFVRWSSDAVTGSGTADELALDNISVEAVDVSPTIYRPTSINASANLSVLGNWTKISGPGSFNPTSFTDDFQIFRVVASLSNGLTRFQSNVTISGSGSTLTVDEGGNLTIPAGVTLTTSNSIEVGKGANLTIGSSTMPTFTGDSINLTLDAFANQMVPAGRYGNLTVSNTSTKTFASGDIEIYGDLGIVNTTLDFSASPMTNIKMMGNLTGNNNINMQGTVSYADMSRTPTLTFMGDNASSTIFNNGVSTNVLTVFQLNVNALNRLVSIGANTTIRDDLTITQGDMLFSGDTLTIGDDATVNGTLTISSDKVVKIANIASTNNVDFVGSMNFQKLIIDIAGVVNFNANLTVNDWLWIANGGINAGTNTITFADGAYLAPLPTDASFTANVTVSQMLMATSDGWHYNGAPLKSKTVGDFVADIPALITPYTYNPTTAVNDGWVAATSATTTNPGTGFIANGPNGMVSMTGEAVVGDGANNTVTAGEAFNFGIIYSESGYQSMSNAKGFNLIANPYLAPVQWSEFNLVSNVDNVRWMWDGSGYQFIRQDGTKGGANSGNDITDLIDVAEGFFIRATAAGAQITVSEAAKLSPMDGIMAPSTVVSNELALTLTNVATMATDKSYIAMQSGNTEGYDYHKDIVKFDNLKMNISSYNQDQGFAYNALPEATQATVVPLNVTGDAGSYVLTVSGLGSFPAGTMCFLKDKYTNTITDVSVTQMYSFNITAAAASAGKDRFEIVFSPMAVTGLSATTFESSLQVWPNPAEGQLFVKSDIAGRAVIDLIDMTGRTVSTTDANLAGTTTLDLNSYTAGVYMLRVSSDQGVVTKRIVIK